MGDSRVLKSSLESPHWFSLVTFTIFSTRYGDGGPTHELTMQLPFGVRPLILNLQCSIDVKCSECSDSPLMSTKHRERLGLQFEGAQRRAQSLMV